MKFELELVRAGRPIDATVARPVKEVAVGVRKALRETTDALLVDGIHHGKLAGVAKQCCRTMLVVAGVLDACMVEPEIADFAEAAINLVEGARGVMDRGLTLHDWPTINAGAVMMEVTMRGICACMGVDYEAAMRAVHDGSEPVLPKINDGA